MRDGAKTGVVAGFRSLCYTGSYIHCCFCSQLLLLENVRFYKEEEKNDAEFAKKVRCYRFRHDTM